MDQDESVALTSDSSAPPGGADAGPPPSLIGRLFVVPAVLVAMMICLAIVVVLFGGTAVGQRPTIEELLRTIETGSGRRTAGVMLLPAEREVWQAAQELANRLARKEKELAPEQFEPTAASLTRILEDAARGEAPDSAAQQKRLFLMLALARLGTESAARTVEGYLRHPDAGLRQYALQGLMEMRRDGSQTTALPAVLELLDDPSHEVQMIACVALGALARPGDETALRALRGKLDADREVQWNAALALARLGSERSRPVLLNMLARGYWEGQRVQYEEAGQAVDRRLTGTEIANHLRAAVEASAALTDPRVRDAIRALRDDPDLSVREAARQAVERWKDAPASPTGSTKMPIAPHAAAAERRER